MHTQIPIYVISLARAAQRRVAISRHLDSYGLAYTLVDGVDGSTLSAAERDALCAPGSSFDPGVIGCYLSHIAVYRLLVAAGHALALVLEDDALLDPRFVPYLKSGQLLGEFDYCLLDCDNVSEDRPVFYNRLTRRLLAPGFPVYEVNLGPALLHAYLISSDGAKQRLTRALPIVKPVDVYSHLALHLKMLVCVGPKAASASELSRQSYTSARRDMSPLRLRWLRRHAWFYRLRAWGSLAWWRAAVEAKRAVRRGDLPAQGDWRRLPSGRNITL